MGCALQLDSVALMGGKALRSFCTTVEERTQIFLMEVLAEEACKSFMSRLGMGLLLSKGKSQKLLSTKAVFYCL